MPPTIEVAIISAADPTPIGSAAAKASAITNATAAVESLKSDSASTSSRSRPSTLASLNVAITETGSVAAMSTPSSIDAAHVHPTAKCIIAAVIPADKTTPSVANVAIGIRSCFNSRQWMYSAASKISGGSSTLNRISLLSGASTLSGRNVIAIPAATRPAVYGICRRRAKNSDESSDEEDHFELFDLDIFHFQMCPKILSRPCGREIIFKDPSFSNSNPCTFASSLKPVQTENTLPDGR